MNLFAHLLFRHRLLVCAAIGLACLTALAGLTRLGFDDCYQDFLRSHDNCYQRFDKLAGTFGAGDGDCLVLLESSDILTRPALAAIRKIHDQADDLPEIESVVSLHSARKARRIGRLILPFFPGEDATDEQVQQARTNAIHNRSLLGHLLSADHQASLVLVRLRNPAQPVDQIEPILNRLRQIIAANTAGTGLTGRLTGMPSIRVETIRCLQREYLLITAAGAGLAAVLAWAILRSLTAVLLVVLPALLGVLLTLGAMGIAGRNLNPLNIVLPVLVLMIGVSVGIHLMFHFRDARALGQTARDAARSVLHDLGGACSLTTLTTAVGFLSLTTSDNQIIREFGVLGSVGVMLTFLVVITLLPILCSTRLGWACTPRYRAKDLSPAAWPDWLLNRLSPLAGWCIFGGFGLSLLLGVVAWQTRADCSFLESLPGSSESYSVIRRTEQKFGGVPTLQVMVEWPHGEKLCSPSTLNVLARVHAALDRSPVASTPVSIYTLLQSLPGEGDDLVTRLGELRHVPADRMRSLVCQDERVALVTAYAPDAGSKAMRRPLAAIDAEFHEIEQAYPGYQLHLTGLSVLATHRTIPMVRNLLAGLSLELIIIFVGISLGLRSLSLGLLSIPSNIFPLLVTAAALVLADWPVQYATVVAFNICFGLAFDDTVHFLSRYQRELTTCGDRLLAVRNSFRAMAPVTVTQTLLMLCGFGAGLFCSIPTVRAFSACSCIALLLALASELVIVPILLLCSARIAKPNTSPVAALSFGRVMGHP